MNSKKKKKHHRNKQQQGLKYRFGVDKYINSLGSIRGFIDNRQNIKHHPPWSWREESPLFEGKVHVLLALGFIQTQTNAHIRMVMSEVNTIKKKMIHVQIRNHYIRPKCNVAMRGGFISFRSACVIYKSET